VKLANNAELFNQSKKILGQNLNFGFESLSEKPCSSAFLEVFQRSLLLLCREKLLRTGSVSKANAWPYIYLILEDYYVLRGACVRNEYERYNIYLNCC
jgi:hypothetical protein